MKHPKPDDETAENDFLMLVRSLQSGRTLAELQSKLKDLLADVELVGKKGTIALTITVNPKANSPQLIFDDEIKVVPPKPERESTILFMDDQHGLSRRDPRQPRLAGLVSEFTTPKGATVTQVNEETGEVKE